MTVYFRPRGDLTRAPQPRTTADSDLYAFLSAQTGLNISSDHGAVVDYENWMEPAKMLEAALRAGFDTKILPRSNLRHAVTNPLATIPGKSCRDMLIGRLINTDDAEAAYFDLGWPAQNENLAAHYAELHSFRELARRKSYLVDMPGEPAPRLTIFKESPAIATVGEVMAEFAGDTCVVKQTVPAKAWKVEMIDLPSDTVPIHAENMLLDRMGYHMAMQEGRRDCLLVQEFVAMTHETRFFVVDGEVICGAACIESDTPQQNQNAATMPSRFEMSRNSGVITDDPEASLALHNFAQQAVREISAEAPQLKSYTIDIALNENREPLVIELNRISGSGLYAIPSSIYFAAIQAAAENAPRHTPKPWDRRDFLGDEPNKVTVADTLFLDEEEWDEAFDE